jgi:hypothetical protein
MAVRGRLVTDIQVLTVDAHEIGRELVTRGRSEQGLDRPVLAGDEGLDLPLTLDHQPDGDRLDAARGQAAAHLARDQRAERVAHQAVDDPARLLGVDQVAIDRTRMGERVADGALGDLAEGHPPGLVLGNVGGLDHVPRDRLPFPIEVGREVDGVRFAGRALDAVDLLAAVVADHVLGREVMVDVHAQLALAGVFGKVANVAVRGQHGIVVAEIPLDGACLRR